MNAACNDYLYFGLSEVTFDNPSGPTPQSCGVALVVHEIGHNMGSDHYVGDGVMNPWMNCALTFSQPARNDVLSYMPQHAEGDPASDGCGCTSASTGPAPPPSPPSPPPPPSPPSPPLRRPRPPRHLLRRHLLRRL